MSAQEWIDLPEDEPGELVDGTLEEEEIPGFLHEIVVAWLVHALHAWAVPRGGFVFGSDAKYLLTTRRGRKPDLSVFVASRRLPRYGAGKAPPDIVIEVLSPTARDERRDRIEKATDYGAFGVSWYWLIDPERRTLEILSLDVRGQYQPSLALRTGRCDRVPGCDGLVLDLDDLWAETDRLAPDDEDGTSE
jgi:Uma2 family endonuclease